MPKREPKAGEYVVYNHGPKPIVIVSSWSPDPFGGPAVERTDHMIMPGQGIDLGILGLLPKRIPEPKRKRARKSK